MLVSDGVVTICDLSKVVRIKKLYVLITQRNKPGVNYFSGKITENFVRARATEIFKL